MELISIQFRHNVGACSEHHRDMFGTRLRHVFDPFWTLPGVFEGSFEGEHRMQILGKNLMLQEPNSTKHSSEGLY